MAVENNTKKKKMFAGGGRRSGSGVKVLRVLVGIVAAIFIALCLFGVINQRATGESFIESMSKVGRTIGETLTYVFTGNEKSPVEVTDQGVYLDGHAPEGSQKILKDKKQQEEDSKKDNKDESKDKDKSENSK